MGIVAASAKFMLDARVLRGVDFTQTLTLGHQHLNLFPSEARRIQAGCRDLLPETADPAVSLRWGDFSDDFLRAYLGVKSLHVLDNSDYEQAGLVHDLNVPVPAAWNEKYDVIIDGGVMEHVFNVPVALESYTRMLKVGGTLFMVVPANNFCGHGFYQFSPELLFRWFSPRNGFELQPPVLVEHGIRYGFSLAPRCFRVTDPAVVHRRVDLCGGARTNIMIEARRVARTTCTAPQQSDYVETWNAAEAEAPPEAETRAAAGAVPARGIKAALDRVLGKLPVHGQMLAMEYLWRYKHSFRNRHHYERLPYLDFSQYAHMRGKTMPAVAQAD